jgi:enoyl-CoA hydratase/carnithine racemase
MVNESVLREEHDGIATLTLNNAKKRNALSLSMMTALKNALEEIGSDRSIRVVIIRADGPVFSAGHDLRELSGQDKNAYEEVFRCCAELMETVRKLPQPVIAEVDGLATAAGCQLVATCDLVVCSQDSRFATPGVKIGLFCTSPGVALARAVSQKKAMEMLLTGTPLSAEEAEQAGLVNRIVPSEELQSATRELAKQIAEASSETVSIGKEAFYRQVQMDRRAAYDFASDVMVENLAMDDAEEGIGAFLEKREPKWKH